LCWRRLPYEYRDAIMTAWQARKASPDNWRPHAIAMHEALLWYQDHTS